MPPLRRKPKALSNYDLRMMAAESNIPMGFSPCDRAKAAQINLKLLEKTEQMR